MHPCIDCLHILTTNKLKREHKWRQDVKRETKQKRYCFQQHIFTKTNNNKENKTERVMIIYFRCNERLDELI